MNENTVVPIQHVITHTRFHLDEVEAIRRLRYLEKFFPGVSVAARPDRVRFTEGLEQDESYFDSMKILSVGCIPGGRFNDKDFQGRRIPEKCATTLVSAHGNLGVDPVLDRIGREVLRCDTGVGVKNTELAELIKMAHRRIPDNTVLFKWATGIMEAIHSQLTLQLAPSSGEKTLKQVFEGLRAKGHFPNEQAQKKLSEFVEESTARRKEITELAFICGCVQRVNMPDALESITFALEHLYFDQISFWDAVAECKRSHDRIQITIYPDRRPQTLRILYITSDNPLIPRAARHERAGGASVVIVRNSKGNVQVFTDNRRNINLVEFVSMIRWLELPKDAKGRPCEDIAWSELGAEGELSAVPTWYFFAKAHQFYNGSLSKPNVEPTRLGRNAFLDVARHAFDPKGVDAWKQARGIRVESPPITSVRNAMHIAEANKREKQRQQQEAIPVGT